MKLKADKRRLIIKGKEGKDYRNLNDCFSLLFNNVFPLFAFLYCTVPHTAHATVIILKHECIQYTAERETEALPFKAHSFALPLTKLSLKIFQHHYINMTKLTNYRVIICWIAIMYRVREKYNLLFRIKRL